LPFEQRSEVIKTLGGEDTAEAAKPSCAYAFVAGTQGQSEVFSTTGMLHSPLVTMAQPALRVGSCVCPEMICIKRGDE
jgi:hypothetical protein